MVLKRKTPSNREVEKKKIIMERKQNISRHYFFQRGGGVAGDRRPEGALTKFLMSDVPRPARPRRLEFGLSQRIRNASLSAGK